MATTNPVLTSSWSLLVPDSGRDFLLSAPDGVEVATTSGSAPTVQGHPVNGYLTRARLGQGYVYGRTVRDSVVIALDATANLALLFTTSVWTTSVTWLTDRTWG